MRPLWEVQTSIEEECWACAGRSEIFPGREPSLKSKKGVRGEHPSQLLSLEDGGDVFSAHELLLFLGGFLLRRFLCSHGEVPP